MLILMSELCRYGIEASDGSIGSIKDVLFEDHTSTVRYLDVDVGSWLSQRRVLLSPSALEGIEPGRDAVQTRLSKQQIKDSPPLESDRPVSRQQEAELHSHYGWAPYWGAAATPVALAAAPYWGAAALPGGPIDAGEAEVAEREPAHGDPHLRSGKEVIGYRIAARDGHIGEIVDLLLDDGDWTLRYAVVDTGNWLPGRRVLLSPQWMSAVDWEQQEVVVDLTREQVETAPPYEPAELDRAYEERMYRHYGHPPYWA